jgi:hypothetical protein
MEYQEVDTKTGSVGSTFKTRAPEATLAYKDRAYVIVPADGVPDAQAGDRVLRTLMQEITMAFSEPPVEFTDVALLRGIPQDQTIRVAGSGQTDNGLLFFVFSTETSTWVAPVYGSVPDPGIPEDSDPFDQSFYTYPSIGPRDLLQLDAYLVGDSGPAQDVFYAADTVFHCAFANSFFLLGQSTVNGDDDPVSIQEPVFDISEIMSGFSGSVGVVFLDADVFCFFFVESYRMLVYTVEIESDGAWEETLRAVVFDDFEDVTDVQTGRLGSTPYVRLVGTEYVYFAPFEDNGKMRGLVRFAWPEDAELVATHDRTRGQMAMFDRFNTYIASVIGPPTVYESPYTQVDVLLPDSTDEFGRIVERP